MNRRVVARAVVVATGVCGGGRGEVVGFAVGDGEDGAFWTAFLRSLKARGLGGVQLVIADAPSLGLRHAVQATMAGAASSAPTGRPATLEPTRQLRGVLRLDQTAALFGLLVRVFKLVGGRWTSVQMIMPVAAAFAVAATTSSPQAGWWPRPPQLLLLGWWAPWLGVLLAGIGNYLHLSAPRRSLGWRCLVLYAAWIGRYLGDQAFGGYLSGFVGGLGSRLAIGLGVLCGYPLYRSLAQSLGWLHDSSHAL